MSARLIKPLVPTEEQVQQSIIDLCQRLGYECLQTSRRGIVCPTCHKKVFGGDGSSFGVPDLLIRYSGWMRGMWLGMEVKRPGGKWTSTEQERLWKEGHTCRVESLEDAAYALSRRMIPLAAESVLLGLYKGVRRPGVFANE